MVVATDGCSRFFIEGKLECRDVDALATDMAHLRADLLADPYFKGVPSLDPARKRTALNFHVKDDPVEVRRLHGYGEHRVVFAQRGHKPRAKAFVDAIAHEDKSIEMLSGLSRPKPLEVVCGVPKDYAGLQAVDYFLWALQPFYERGEARFLDYVWPQTLEIIDLDAAPHKIRGRPLGEFVIFNKEHPLNLESRAGVGNGDQEI